MINYNLSQLNVIVIEPQKLMKRLMRDVLHSMNANHVEVIDDPDELRDAIKKTKADVIFMDWSPELNGVDLLKRIRDSQDENERFLPVIMCSAFTELRHICAARDAGMHEYLAKPVSAKLIYRRICSLLEHERDFVQTTDFFGPDRRRRHMDIDGRDRRTFTARLNGNSGALPELSVG